MPILEANDDAGCFIWRTQHEVLVSRGRVGEPCLRNILVALGNAEICQSTGRSGLGYGRRRDQRCEDCRHNFTQY